VEGRSETLRYANVVNRVVTTQLIDDGTTDGSLPHSDGRHLVGDDSSIVVTAGGEVRVVYQDSTQQRAMVARRRPGSTTWTLGILDQQDQTGFWLKQVLSEDTSFVATFFRNERAEIKRNGVRILQFE
jgi:hypothetical protein